MVMATSFTCRRESAASSPHEAIEMQQFSEGRESMTMHDRLVAYVHAIDNPHDGGRSDVWVEHSYARDGRGAGAGGGSVRVLLAARAAAPEPLDVEAAPPPPPEPPADPADSDDDSDGADDDDEWEARLAALAPHADHARLAAVAVDCLRRVRLARLAGGRFAGRAAVAEQARRLRLALAPLWAGGAGGAQRPGPWLHAALFACAPPGARRTYARLVAELRRAVPRLCERLTGARGPGPAPAPAGAEAAEGPWLVWVGGGRWARRLGARVHTRRLRLTGAPQPPEAWVASAAGAVRSAFADILAEAGSRPVVVGGCGGGATLAGALASGGAVRGALLLAPALQTAEGPREGRGRLTRAPALLVAGGGAAGAWRGALAEALGARQRLLLVGGARDSLRLPAAQRRRRRLDQRALDAAVVEECVRWIREICEEPDDEPDDDVQVVKGAESSEEEYAHLPAARSPPAAPPAAAAAASAASTAAAAAAPPLPPLAPLTAHATHAAGSDTRSIEIVEGRVVSRGPGGTPLALMPPRRSSPLALAAPAAAAAAAPALAAADIMQLPIVFADDDRTVAPQPDAGVAPGGVTVTSGSRRGGARRGALRYTRVIVAKRAAPAPATPRPLLVRRGVRLVPRTT